MIDLCIGHRDQSGPGSDANEGLLRIHQSSRITETSPSYFLISYPRHSIGGSYPSAEKQSVYSTATVNWVKLTYNIILK